MQETHAVRQHRLNRESNELQHRAKAEQVWHTMTKDQQTLVRFGMFPIEVMAAVEAEKLWDAHLIVVGLMDMASKHGGMRA